MSKHVILVVEDEKDYADSIAEMLRGNDNYEVITAYCAKDGLVELKKNVQAMGLLKNRIECIILDIKMPGMDGLEFLRVVREEYHERIGVIILTAFEDEDKWEKARQGAAAGYILKPFREDVLLGKVDEFFKGHLDRMIDVTNLETHAKKFAAQLREDFHLGKEKEDKKDNPSK
ncbi:MAG: response regulator [Candidatus Saganbacteria bacterium]|nr:response regulator [Candidatus Saganbacteria bacterium]